MAAAPPNPESTEPVRGLSRGRLAPVLRGVVLGVVLALTGEAVRVFLSGNLHTVVPGRVYRCAQQSPAGLDRLLGRYGIRTVVNLRGCCPSFAWYLAEARAVACRDAAQEDVCFSARRLPSVAEVRRLVEALDRVEYPILLHCHQGIDRTGLAAAVALLLHTEVPYAKARRQLGPRYGHVRLGMPAHLDHFFDYYEGWLREGGRTHSRGNFRHWAEQVYDGGPCMAEFEPLDLPGVVRPGRPVAGRVRVHNRSRHPWRFSAGSTAGVHLLYVVAPASGGRGRSGRAGLFNAVVGPGESIDVEFALPPPPGPGRYAVTLDVIDEQHCCFFQVGSEPLQWEFDVREQEATVGREPGPAGLAGLANQLAPGR